MSLNGTAEQRRFTAGKSDLLIAVGCLLVAMALLAAVPVIETGLHDVPSSLPSRALAWWAPIVTVIMQVTALACGRGLPRLVPIMTAAVPLPLAVLAPGSSFSATNVAILASVYLAGTRIQGKSLVLVASADFLLILVATAMNLVGSSPPEPFPVLAGAGQAAIVVGAPLFIALVVVNRRRSREAHERELAALDREHRALAREQDARVASAIADERTSVARDLHDIAAHHMSGIAMLAAAIEREIDASPASAKESANDIRVQSISVLGDLRRIVGLLRDDEMAPLADRSLASITQLVDDRRASGAEVSITIDSDERALGDGVSALAQLVGYRMVQESLANAAVHAPGAASSVIIRTDGEQVKVDVRNDAGSHAPLRRSSRQGFGLVGMRERAELVGAALDYGSTPNGGWAVTLCLPYESEAKDDRRDQQG